MTVHSYGFSEGQKVLAEGTARSVGTVTAPRRLKLLEQGRELLVQLLHEENEDYLRKGELLYSHCTETIETT